MSTTSKMVSLKLKLVIDKTQNRVLFAEATKDFVDFIFHILSLPLATVTRILSKSNETRSAVPGCMGSLYKGLKDLDDCYIDQTNKQYLLNYKANFRGAASLGLLPEASYSSVSVFWQCTKSKGCCLSYDQKSRGNNPCQHTRVLAGDEGGYVREQAVIFMVMDDLAVKPMSTAAALSLIGTNVSNFDFKNVDFGRVEALKLLKSCLQSKTVLTDVFLSGVDAAAAVKTEPPSPRKRKVPDSDNSATETKGHRD